MTWENTLLGDLFQIGSSKRVLKAQWKQEGVPFYRGREITKLAADGFVSNELFISEEHYLELAEKAGVPKSGDIVITAIGTIGNSHIVREQDRFYFKDASVLWLKKTTDISSEFVNYWLKAPLFFNQLDKGNGATVDTLTIQRLKSVQLDLPPLPEQRRIVAILDEAFEGIATATSNAERNLANAREVFESYLNSVFTQKGEGWEIKPLYTLAQSSLGKMLDKKKNRGVLKPYLRNLNVRWFEFDLSDLKVMKFLPEEQEKYTAIKGDVLICEGGYPGRAAIWENDYPIHFQKAIHRVRFNAPELSKWFLYYLYLSDITNDLKQHFTGAGIQHFTGQALKRFMLPIAPLSEVRAIVASFDELSIEINRLELIYQQKLTALAELKKSILNKAFSGELK